MQKHSIYSDDKAGRILHLYAKLMNGGAINKAEEAERFNVHQKTIQRDIEDLRAFFENQVLEGSIDKQLVYDKTQNAYYLCDSRDNTLTNSEILAVCKILLESRAFCKNEIEPIILKLLDSCVPKSKRDTVRTLISNEMFHYVEPHHRKKFVESLWDLGTAVKEHRLLRLTYEKQSGAVVQRVVQPVGIMFSEFYFYLTAFIEDIDRKTVFDNPDDLFPTIYRIDRIQSFEVLNTHFDVPYKDRFEEGEFRKRIQFMYGGKLRRIKFLYKGPSVEAVLDRLPTAQIIERNSDGYLISAEVFGDGVDMWLRSQGENIITINN